MPAEQRAWQPLGRASARERFQRVKTRNVPPQRHRCHQVRAKVMVHEYEDGGGTPKRTFHLLWKTGHSICFQQATSCGLRDLVIGL